MKASRTVVVGIEAGLHARPSDMIARLASRFQAKINLVKGNERVDARSILGILTLGAAQGTQLFLEADGPDAEEALSALGELFQNNFPEPTDSGPQH